MGYTKSKNFFYIGIIFLLYLFIISCSTPSWFPIKKSPPSKAKLKELIDKEVIIIEGEEYVKVLNKYGKSSKVVYIPVNEYLLKKDEYITPTYSNEKDKKEVLSNHSNIETEKETPLIISSAPFVPKLKKKILISHFDDRVDSKEEILGDWITERFIKELNKRTSETIFVDYKSVENFLNRRGILSRDFKKPDILRLISEIFGVHLFITGELTGPYIFIEKGKKENSSSAILKMEIKLINALTGKVINTFAATNSIISSKEYGVFSEEKAKSRAIEICIAELSRSLIEEIGKTEWFCRVAKIEGDEVYINAGRLTGIREGDILNIFGSTDFFKSKEKVKGKVQISNLFGIDASRGRLIHGEKPELEDILILARKK